MFPAGSRRIIYLLRLLGFAGILLAIVFGLRPFLCLMRAVLQRVSRASVVVNDATVGEIDAGVLIFLGMGQADSAEDIKWLVGRITKLRIFEDESGRMNESLVGIGGEALVIDTKERDF